MGDEALFIIEDINAIVKDSIESVIRNAQYNAGKVDEWTNDIIEQCLLSLLHLNRPFKYIVTCTILQKTGAGYHMVCSYYWDQTSDGVTTIRWESRTLYVIKTIIILNSSPTNLKFK
ncbi:hypothetical protein SNEBB_010315 [Seison nebaliae]|nr:hypothetical protein SNEBB_010315 [Seison nebaliae]